MMDAARYASGQTFDEFLAAARKYEELWQIGARRAKITADALALLEPIVTPVHFVILNEDWCLDAVGTVPYVVKLASMMRSADARVFGRDANPDLMDAHLSRGTRSIPVVIVYDDQWHECGWWGPRPKALQDWVLETGVGLAKPERYHYIRSWYAHDRGDTTVREIAAIVSSCVGGAGAGAHAQSSGLA